jgi:hypothetical protein
MGDEPMDRSRNDQLGELAGDAALERGDFLVQATEQLRKFLDSNGDRIQALGGLTLIDDDPDYLSIAPDLTFRSRSRYLDDDTGEWVSETEILESAAELVELYNPADIYAAFAEAARTAAGLSREPTAAEDLMDTAGIAPGETFRVGADPYAEAADAWAAGADEPDDEEEAAARLYDLALTYQERSQQSEAELIEAFETEVNRLSAKLGDIIIVDDNDERLTLEASGNFKAEVVPEEANGEWKTLSSPEALVEFYDPTDVFGDLAEALAEAYPSVSAGADGDDDEDDDEDDDDAESDDETVVEGTGEAAEDDGDDGKGPLRTGDSLA